VIKCIGMDPPWLERGGGKSKRGADRHYPLMSKQEIFQALKDSTIGGEFSRKASCHLWMWATSNYLPDALWLMQVLGFTYKTSAAWVKVQPCVRIGHDDNGCERPAVDLGLQIGLGQYMRHAHELLLLGTRGDAMVPEPADRLPSVIFAPRTRHSEKPAEAYALIERASPGARLECFAREQRKGWTVWGDQV